jgi:hypothetical protein
MLHLAACLLLGAPQLLAASGDSSPDGEAKQAIAAAARSAVAPALDLARAAWGQNNGSPAVAGGPATNGTSTVAKRIEAEIDAGLKQVKAKLADAGKRMEAALAASEARQALSISNTAVEIRNLAVSDLADSSVLVKEVDRLVQKMENLYNHGAILANDKSEPAADTYAHGLAGLQAELTQLKSRRESIGTVRNELLEKAKLLDARARAIAWLDVTEQTESASKAFREAVDDVLAFARRVGSLIDQLDGKSQPVT